MPKPLYKYFGSKVATIGSYNTDWNTAYFDQNGTEIPEEQVQDLCFHDAVEKASSSLTDSVLGLFTGFIPAYSIVKRSVEARTNPQIMELQDYCPWKKHLHDIEEELGLGDAIK